MSQGYVFSSIRYFTENKTIPDNTYSHTFSGKMVRYLYQTQHSQPRVIAVLLLISDFLKYNLSFCTSAQYTRFTCFCVRPRIRLAGQCPFTARMFVPEPCVSVFCNNRKDGVRGAVYRPDHNIRVRSPSHHPYPGENDAFIRRTRPALTAVFFRDMVYIHKTENDTDPLRGFFGWSAIARQAKMDLSRTDVAV